jgi:transcription termination factor Rho
MAPIKRRRQSETTEDQAQQNPEQAQLELASTESDRQEQEGARQAAEERAVTEPGEKRVVVRSRLKRKPGGFDGGQQGQGREGPHREYREGREGRDNREGRRYRDNGHDSRDHREEINQQYQANQAALDAEAQRDNENKPKLTINELTRMGMHPLRELAIQYGVPHEDMVAMKKQEIIFQILKAHTEHGASSLPRAPSRSFPTAMVFFALPRIATFRVPTISTSRRVRFASV